MIQLLLQFTDSITPSLAFEDLISTQNSDELYFSDAFPHMQSTIRQGDISPAASTRRSQAFHRNPHKLRDSDDFSATSSSVSNSMLSQSGLGHEEDGENEEGSGCNGWQSLADGDIFCATNPIATMNMDQSPSTEDLFQELSKPEDIWMEPDTITDEVVRLYPIASILVLGLTSRLRNAIHVTSPTMHLFWYLEDVPPQNLELTPWKTTLEAKTVLLKSTLNSSILTPG